MTALQYAARKGARFKDEDAAVLGREFDQLGTDCTAEQVVEAARSHRSSLHRYFEWDDTLAAEQHRLSQARYYLRFVDIVIETEDGGRQTRAWHQVVIHREDGDQRAYVHSLEISQDEDYTEQVVAKALRELQGWKRRYAEYQEVFGELFQVIEKAAKKVKKRKAIA